MNIPTALLLAPLLLTACGRGSDDHAVRESAPQPETSPAADFRLVGTLESNRIDEASGIQAGAGNVFFVHNDEGARLYLTDDTGRNLGIRDVEDARNRDWEDITRVPGPDGPLLVIGDIGDNRGVRDHVSLYFLPEVSPNDADGTVRARHRLRFSYPDGPRDVESMAYDAAGGRLLLLSKRDHPPRLYGLPLDLALWQHEMVAEFLGEVPGLRPPSRSDILRNPVRGLWVSQPTGMDISPDGRLAAVLTYRSLYLFRRDATESWVDALQGQPEEFVGPPGTHDEAVSFSLDGRSIYVTTEGRPAPLYRLELPDP